MVWIMKTDKPVKTTGMYLRLTEQERLILEELSRAHGKSMTAMITALVREAWTALATTKKSP